jgi:hypothetical protein
MEGYLSKPAICHYLCISSPTLNTYIRDSAGAIRTEPSEDRVGAEVVHFEDVCNYMLRNFYKKSQEKVARARHEVSLIAR